MTPFGDDPIELRIAEVVENELFVDEADFGDVLIRTLHSIEPSGGGKVRVVYRTEITGPAADEVGPRLGPEITADFPDTIAALIQHAESAASPLAGGCMCQAVRFEVSEPLLGALYCHCKRCQRRTGSAFSVSALTVPDSFRITQGEELVRSWRPPGDGWVKSFCGDCGSQLFTTHRDNAELVSVRMGALDGDPGIRPSAHQFVNYAAAWDPIPDDGLPRFPERLPAGGESGGAHYRAPRRGNR